MSHSTSIIFRPPFRARMIARHKAPGSIAGISETVFIIIEPGFVRVRGFVDEARHLIPDFDGATFPSEWREALWARIRQLL